MPAEARAAAPLNEWLARAPKAELHLHIDGCLEPGRLLQLADKHGVPLPYGDEADVLAAYDFDDLQSFLDLYYLGASVLRDAEDFHLLMPLFACRKWDGTPQSRENQTLKWVRPNALRDYPMPPADIPLIPILRDWL